MKLRKIVLFIFAVMLCFGCVFENHGKEREKGLIINEVCTKNDFGYADEYGRRYDWIELYNAGDKAISLNGYGLTNQKSNLEKFKFHDETLEANEYLIIFCAEGLEEKDKTDKHADFQLNSEGESIYLVNELNQIVDFVETPELVEGVSFARETDGGTVWQEQEPSPGRSNENIKDVSAPVFSVPSGFYSEEFEVTVSAESSSKIYYTFDGSVPNEDSYLYDGTPITIGKAVTRENIYSARQDTSPWFLVKTEGNYIPGRVDKADIVRAVAYDEYGNASDVVTVSYFVGFESKKEYQDMSIISLVAEPEDLFGYNKGIYTMGREYDKYTGYQDDKMWSWRHGNYSLRGKQSERKVHIDFFNEKKQTVFSQNGGIRIKGWSSRGYVQKSLNLFAREEYDGNCYFKQPFFEDGNLLTSVSLFAGGNDNETKIRDYLSAILAENMDLEFCQYRPCAVFINGEYWGFYYINEKMDAHYMACKYDVPEKDVIFIKDEKLEVGIDNDFNDYLEDIAYISSVDVTVQENWERVCEMIDIQSCIDYYSLCICIGRYGDWPAGNYGLWRTREKSDENYGDGKWRWVLFDVNSKSMEVASINSFQDLMEKDAKFANLITNEEFKERLLKRIVELMEGELSPEAVISKIEDIAERNRPQMLLFYDRFFNGIYSEETYNELVYDYGGLVSYWERRKGMLINIIEETYPEF